VYLFPEFSKKEKHLRYDMSSLGAFSLVREVKNCVLKIKRIRLET
jgi:hypothetical protein